MSASSPRAARRTLALLAATLLGACQDSVADPTGPSARPTSSTSSTSSTPAAAPAAATLGWNKLARDLVAKHGVSAPASIRTFALLSVAQYNAVVGAERGAPRDADRWSRPHRAATRGAVAGASAAVLAYAFPQEAASLATLVDAEREATPTPGDGPEDFGAGVEAGREVAAGLIARAGTDRYFAPFTGSVPVCPGCWVASPTPPAFATLGQAKPYFLASNAQFRPPPPPAFGSRAFRAGLAEVRHIAATRTAAQDSIAKFWALPVGTVGAQGYFNQMAAGLAARYGRSEREAARALALLNMAAYDAIVASHEAKYHYWLIRPSQADTGIVRAIGLPSFPAYPSNHATLASVAATVLGRQFPRERARLAAMAEEAAISRVYGGIHYRFDTDAGLALGRAVGAWTLAHDAARGEPFVLSR